MAKRRLNLERGDLVFTSEDGLVERSKPPREEPGVPDGDGIVRVARETKGRKGKGVTLVSGVPLAPKELKALAKRLKARCSAGGAIKDGVIELQGDQRDTVVAELQAQGYTVKRAGG